MADFQPPRLPPRQQLVARHKWPFVGEKLPRACKNPWTLTITGLVTCPQTWTLSELHKLPSVTRTLDIHCVTRWSKFDVKFTGLRLLDLLDTVAPLPEARFASFVARSTRNHSTSLPCADLTQLDPLVAWMADDEPLSTEHGGPLRLITPQRYFYKSLKWLERIELLSADRLGYWEQDAGYHNHADPWKEERYVAGQLTKQQAAKLIESRDCQGLDLLGFDGRGRDLAGLKASGAKMRDADFCGAQLKSADFTAANLSNAKLRDCDLRGACFRDADLEGADLGGADLRDVDFHNASLFGASFVDPPDHPERRIARFSVADQLSQSQLEMLTDEQQHWVREAMNS